MPAPPDGPDAAAQHHVQRVNISGLGHGAYRSLYLRTVKSSEEFEVIEDATDKDCDVYFIVPCDREELHQRLLRLHRGCRVNHFPGMVDICEKVSFCRAVRQCTVLCPRLGEFIPPTWILPDELPAVLEMLGDPVRGQHHPFIVKPEYGLQGNGIFIVRTRSDLEVALAARGLSVGGCCPRYVCQHYIPHPLTLDGYKFDLRLYVAVTSLVPLEAALCREGLARFCTTPYAAPSAANIGVRTGHLTNYALNSRQKGFVRSQAGDDPETASKRLLSTTLRRLHLESGGMFNEANFWAQMEEIVAMLLLALLPALSATAAQYFPLAEGEPSRCYHVLGLDVLLDEDHWPWLLEVNSAPAMDIETAVPVPRAPERKTSLPPRSSARTATSTDARAPSMTPTPARAAGHRGTTGGVQRSASSAELCRDRRSLSSSASGPARAEKHPRLPQPAFGKEPVPLPTPFPDAFGEPRRHSESDAMQGVLEESAQSPPPGKPRVRHRKRRSKAAPAAEPPDPPRHTDPWGGYQPSKLRRRQPWPEICFCMAHSEPHQHVLCEVDERAKTVAMSGAMRLLAGRDSDAYWRIRFPPELARVLRALRGFSALCSRLSGTRCGLSGQSLRRALLACEEVVSRCTGRGGHGAGCRLAQHEIDLLTIPRGIGAEPLSLQRQKLLASAELRGTGTGARAELSVLALFDMMLDVSRKCCERDAELATRSPLEKLEWLLEALQSESAEPAGGAPWPPLTHSTIGKGLPPAIHMGRAQRGLGSGTRSPSSNSGAGDEKMPPVSAGVFS